MFSKTLIAFVLTFIFTFSTAFPVAVPAVNIATRAACSTAVENLVNGINQNIAVQKNEQGQTTVIQQELAQSTPNNSDFQSSKSKLIDIVNQGISIRTNNQKIAPQGNAAIPGLATVATAQAGELKMAQALTGNPSTDNPNLQKLQTMFSGGITQNQKNAQAAATGCTI